ncbi:DUF3667 domain-containing protein [Flammeovirgaceae bacterium SG7u.111]|nr:DUF3667 domain-containing protein [Flammeovirgaceae bacterium SG7u.132]WPO34134.1 DUF3667 domain-containing protein [Flammeovirgaceae bacterium SG7u.111]
MHCKNCKKELAEEVNYCDNCGGKVIRERITFKNMVSNLLATAFGWDNKYFMTLKALVLQPETILKEFINGTRNKYVNPFTFFAIGMAIAILTFNQFEDHYLKTIGQVNEAQFEMMDETVLKSDIENEERDSIKSKELSERELKLEEVKKKQREFSDNIQKGILKNFNIISFLMLPLYAFIAFKVFGKPYNYGEHFIISAYIQGVTFLTSSVLFLASLLINPSIFLANIFIVMLYYIYCYKRLYQYSLKQVLAKIGRFIIVLLLVSIVFMLISIAVGLVIGKFMM